MSTTNHGPAGRLLLLHGGDRRKLRDLSLLLRPLVATLDTQEGMSDLSAASNFDLVLVEYDPLSRPQRQELMSHFSGQRDGPRLLLLSEGGYQEDLVLLFGSHTLTNLIGLSREGGGALEPQDLIVTVQKVLRREIFGLTKYFAWGVTPRVETLTRSVDRTEVVNNAETYANSLGVNPRLVWLYRSVAEELITNALYNAPIDAQGNSRFRNTSRKVEIALEEHERVEVSFTCDGRRLGISVSDPFGSLTQARLLDYLSRCFRKGDDQVEAKEGGSGIGFFQIFRSLTHFIVNISPGKRTEVIGLIDVRGTYKDFAERNKSFNIFMAP